MLQLERLDGMTRWSFVPYEVRLSAASGRYAVATRDIEAGTLLLQEEPCVQTVGDALQATVCQGASSSSRVRSKTPRRRIHLRITSSYHQLPERADSS